MDPALLDLMWFRLLAGFLFGLVLGSFTTMLSYRAPRNISIINPPSHCPKCHTPQKPRDLVPVFSWMLERGKCRHCKTEISPRYLLIEFATTVLVMSAFAWLGFKPQTIIAIVGIVALVALVTINIERQRNN